MNLVLTACAFALAVNLAAGLLRVARRAHPLDRLVAAQLPGTLGVALLLVLAELQADPTLRLVAMLLALLGSFAAIALLRLAASGDTGRAQEGET
ncbi:MAG: multiple resistance and pH regulation protein F [Gammaproteobacteria bacterium]|nr:multiple resistance and pH regulation protein F [Gammaproteobacteria bacterium]